MQINERICLKYVRHVFFTRMKANLSRTSIDRSARFNSNRSHKSSINVLYSVEAYQSIFVISRNERIPLEKKKTIFKNKHANLTERAHF
jgi:hypothetical protein